MYNYLLFLIDFFKLLLWHIKKLIEINTLKDELSKNLFSFEFFLFKNHMIKFIRDYVTKIYL